MPCTGSVKSGDSIMLSCLSPRSPCCGPNAALSWTPGSEASASSEWARFASTDAGCATSAMRRPASGWRSALSSSSRSIPNFIELQGKGVAMMEIRLSGGVPERPVRKRGVVFFDDGGQSEHELPRRRNPHAGAELERLGRAAHRDRRFLACIGRGLPIRGKDVARPFGGRRKIELHVALAGALGDEELASRVLP